jgi:hypothetical protein
VIFLTWAKRAAVVRAVNWFMTTQLPACLYVTEHKSFLSIKRKKWR